MVEPLLRVPRSPFIPKAHSPPLGSRGSQERLVCAQRGSDVRIPNIKDGGEGLGIECLEALEHGQQGVTSGFGHSLDPASAPRLLLPQKSLLGPLSSFSVSVDLLGDLLCPP